ncbi:hypothetical protein SCP_0104410 [Sparassis crispa]|uniref:Uncharacterized protein n=1 Tax=Sparassis crispa TaxID=139825 RepID=A0A401G5X8_9APHY|nr:hypothetical protein SCP_0104410 [Sparassis crispa]GBE77563.1 hypothetical protein SCP_0104410 [Sparassis crispa]
MSTWGIGDNHDSDEVFALKKQLLEKDAHNDTLLSQLSKKDIEISDIRTTLNDISDKLRREADGKIQLEEALGRCTEEFKNERNTRQNTDSAFALVQKKLKNSEQAARELQATVDMLSSHADSSSTDKVRLERDNDDLRTLVRQLRMEVDARQQREEAQLRRSESATTTKVQCRRRSSSVSTFRTSALEQETSELRLKNAQQVSEITTLSDRLARSQTTLVQVENEKIAMERRLHRQLQEMQAVLEEREEELKISSGLGGQDAAERESRLLERLEEEEERAVSLQAQLERITATYRSDMAVVTDQLNRTQRQLEEKETRVQDCDSRLLELAAEKESTLEEQGQSGRMIADLQMHIQALESRITASLQNPPSSPGFQTEATVQRLLNAIDRLREERDALRRDLEFIKAENRFAVEDLQAKLAAAHASDIAARSASVTDEVSQREILELLATRKELERRLAHHERATTVLALVAQYVDNQRLGDLAQVELLLESLAHSNCQLLDAQEYVLRVAMLDEQVQHLQTQLAASAQETDAARSQVSFLQSAVQTLEDDISRERGAREETATSLAHVEAEVADITHALTDAEAQRDALALQLKHTQQDLESAQQELAEADTRYGQQLCAMSSGEATRALRKQIETLEQRVLRRTEQIGVHQHDIKRLETNLRLQEERVAEMTTELEVALSEKDAMVEDCRTTREERDEARSKCEEIEETLEQMEESRDTEVETLVGVIVSTVARQRHVADEMRVLLAKHAEEEARLREQLHVVQVEGERLVGEVNYMSTERDHAVNLLEEKTCALRSLQEEKDDAVNAATRAALALQEKTSALRSLQEDRDIATNASTQAALALDEKTSALLSLQQERDNAADAAAQATRALEEKALALQALQKESDVAAQEAMQASVALAELHKEWRQNCHVAQVLEGEKLTMQKELETSGDELRSKVDEIASLQHKIQSLEEQYADGQVSNAACMAELQTKFEGDLQALRLANTELESLHQQDADKLEKIKEELQSYVMDNTTRSQDEAALRDRLEQLQASHSKEFSGLQSRLEKVSAELQEANRVHDEATAADTLVQDELLRSKQQLESQLAEATSKLSSIDRASGELAEMEERHQGELDALQAKLNRALDGLDQVTKARDELRALQEDVAERLDKSCSEMERLEAELTRSRVDHEGELKDLQHHLDLASAELEEAKLAHAELNGRQGELLKELSNAKQELKCHLESSGGEVERLKAELQSAIDAHARVQRSHETELQAALEKQTNQEASLQKEVSAVRAELEQTEASLQALQEEKIGLQCDITSMEAENQRLKSLQRFLESQAKDSEKQVTSLKEELERSHADYTRIEKACKAAEVNLSMQVIQSEQSISALRREVSSLRASPKLEEIIAELKEQNTEMEELLRKKSVEIEENDDRFIDMLKEKKKLTNKVESLTRKVQSLQTKLASSTNPVGESSTPTAPAPGPTSAVPLQRTASKHAPPHPPAPTVPAYTASAPRSLSRVVSEPPAQPRSKTPDRRTSQAPAFRPRTPETRRMPLQPEPEASSSTAGKKRRAPDDFEDCESAPRQGFTVDSLPSTEITTPRMRRTVPMRTGFTPVRSRSNSDRASASPTRRVTTGAPASSALTIADVTNSPRGARADPEKAAKRGWLGKIRNVPAQVTRASRAPDFGSRESGRR